MTNPVAAEKSDFGRMYRDPETGAKYPSVTNVKDVLSKDFLKYWAAKVVAERAVENFEVLYEKIRLDGPEKARKWCSGALYEASKGAAVRGSDLHDLAEKEYKGEPIIYGAINETTLRMLAQYRAFLKDMNVTILASELTLANRAIQYAGSTDLVGIVPSVGPEPRILDIKTSIPQLDEDGTPQEPKGPYSEWALQLSAYANAEMSIYKDPNGEGFLKGDVFDVSKEDALVIQITPYRYKLYQADITDAWNVFQRCREIWDWHKMDASEVFDVLAEAASDEIVDAVSESIKSSRSRAEMTIVWQDSKRAGTWTEVHDALSKEVAKSFAA